MFTRTLTVIPSTGAASLGFDEPDGQVIAYVSPAEKKHILVFKTRGHSYWASRLEPSKHAKVSTTVCILEGEWKKSANPFRRLGDKQMTAEVTFVRFDADDAEPALARLSKILENLT